MRVVVSHPFVQVIRHPGREVIVAEVEQSGHVVRTAHHIQQQASHAVFRLFEQVSVVIVQIAYLADFSAYQVVERAGLQQGVSEVFHPGGSQSHTHFIQLVKITCNVLLGEVLRHAGQVAHQLFPPDASQLREVQQGGHLPVDFQKGDILEAQRTVGHDALELHAQVLGIVTDFHQVAAPVDGGLWRAQHQFGHYPDFGHDLLRHHVIDAPVVVILRTAAPDAEVRQSLVLQEFGCKDSRCCHLRCRVVLQDVIDLLPVVAFGQGLRTEGGSHGRYGTRVIVHAVVLGMDTLHESERKYDQDKRQSFHHLFISLIFLSLCYLVHSPLLEMPPFGFKAVFRHQPAEHLMNGIGISDGSSHPCLGGTEPSHVPGLTQIGLTYSVVALPSQIVQPVAAQRAAVQFPSQFLTESLFVEERPAVHAVAQVVELLFSGVVSVIAVQVCVEFSFRHTQPEGILRQQPFDGRHLFRCQAVVREQPFPGQHTEITDGEAVEFRMVNADILPCQAAFESHFSQAETERQVNQNPFFFHDGYDFVVKFNTRPASLTFRAKGRDLSMPLAFQSRQ